MNAPAEAADAACVGETLPCGAAVESGVQAGGGGWRRTGPVLAALLLALAVVIAPGVLGYLWQLREGLGVTGLQQPVFWGVYTVNFVFFIGIAHAGTLISAVLRLLWATWQRPIVRIAEATTVIMLLLGTAQLLIDVGRPLRAPWFMLWHGRFESPLLWDMTCLLAYLYASVLYLYVTLIPDLASWRDRARGRAGRVGYGILALGWCGAPTQERALQRLGAILAVLVVPIAVSVHSVIAFLFALTLQPMWHSTIFAPYFVVGAIYSGLAAVLLILLVARQTLAQRARIPLDALQKLGRLLLVLALVWGYFTFVEHLTVFYGGLMDEAAVLRHRLSGPAAPLFWGMIGLNLAVPLVCLIGARRASVGRLAAAALAVLVGMWLERYLIIVPSLLEPRLPVPTPGYLPSWVEGAVLLASLGLFVLAMLVLARWLPLLPQTAGTVGPSGPTRPDGWLVRLGQWSLPALAVLFNGAVVVWLGRLALQAIEQGDAPAAAIGVTAVAVPLFLVLMGVSVRVFLALRRGGC